MAQQEKMNTVLAKDKIRCTTSTLSNSQPSIIPDPQDLMHLTSEASALK